MATWERLAGGVALVAVGQAGAAAIEPVLEVPRQKAWTQEPNRVLDLGTLAHLVAQGLVDEAAAVAEAERSGFNGNRLRAMAHLQLHAPPVAEALTLWRRGKIDEAAVDHALAKAQIETSYWPAIKELEFARLDPAVIALAIVRGIMHDPGFLPVGPPSGSGKVKPFPTSELDTLAEAVASGVDRDRLFVETAIAGRPMGPEAAASAVFRQIIEQVDYDRAIAEGDVRNEWAAAIFEQARQIASVADYVAAHLRGHITEAEMFAGAARHGMSESDTRLIFLRSGRPAAPGQMATAVARGVAGPAGRPMDEAQFLLGIAESDIRPEWGPMLWGIRFAYPPLFQINRLVQSHAITAETALAWAAKDRYAPEVLTALAAYWGGGATAAQKDETAAQLLDEYEGLLITEQEVRSALGTLGYHGAALDMEVHLADARRVKKARDAVVKAAHDAYVGHNTGESEALGTLQDLQVSAEAAQHLVSLWGLERNVARKTLTAAQIRRAYTRNQISYDQALAELEDKGYTQADADTYLKE